jgi:hypothetical protein
MARVKRFIFNSDFMTVASAGRAQLSMTIPAGETVGGQYGGERSYLVDIPENCWARCRVKYTGQYGSVDMACNGWFWLFATKNGKQIQYLCNLAFEPGNLKLVYYVFNATDSSTVLTDAQTVTLIIDFLKQPNT